MTAVWGGSMANGKWEVGRKSGEAASFLPPSSPLAGRAAGTHGGLDMIQ